jgi:hypothetical protein
MKCGECKIVISTTEQQLFGVGFQICAICDTKLCPVCIRNKYNKGVGTDVVGWLCPCYIPYSSDDDNDNDNGNGNGNGNDNSKKKK